MDLSYDDEGGGRIKKFNSKIYTYQSGSIHGPSAIGDNVFEYDDNGNQKLSDGRTIIYTAFNKAETIYKDSNKATFEYDTKNARFKRTDEGYEGSRTSFINETTYYIGNVEFITDTTDANYPITKSKRYIADAVITRNTSTPTDDDFTGLGNTVRYLHKDHLGSIQSVTDNNGHVISHLSYDAFGRRRDAGDNTSIIDANPIRNVTKDGFTGQEHIDQLGIINFNARLYDPTLGIMLQADTIIPDGPVTQSMNRYSYVFNNPLSFTDPSGHVPQDGNPNQISEGFGGLEGASSGMVSWDSSLTGIVGHNLAFSNMIRENIGNSKETVVSGVQNSTLENKTTAFGIDSGLTKNDAKIEREIRDAAHNSSCSYSNDCDRPASGYVRLSDVEINDMPNLNPEMFTSISGFKARLFYDRYSNNLQLAFVGTEADIGDVIADYQNAMNKLTPQYDRAKYLAVRVSASANKLGMTLSYTGHSLGGGLASLASITTGNPAITFNAAGLNSIYINSSPYSRQANSLISAFYIKGEALSSFQDHPKNMLFPRALGKRNALMPTSNSISSLDLHRQVNVCMSLQTSCNY